MIPAMAEPDQVVGCQPYAISVVAAKHRHIRALHRTRDEHGRQAVVLGKRDVRRRSADRRRHDYAIGTELQQRVDEIALLFEFVIMVGEDEGLPRAIQFVLDRLQDFGEERVHDVVHDNADDARARRAQRSGAAIVDVTDLAGVFLDPLARRVCDQRTVAERQRHGRGGDPERVCDGRQLDLLAQDFPSRKTAQD